MACVDGGRKVDVYTLKLNPVEAETTWSNESDNFLPVVREADLSTGPP